MRLYESHEIYDAPPEIVFRLGTDPDQFAELFPRVLRTWDVLGDGTHVGDAYRFEERYPGHQVFARTEVTEAEPPAHWKSVTRYEDGTVLTWTTDVTTLPDGRTQADDLVVYEVGSGLLAKLMDEVVVHRLVESSLAEANRRFRAAVERAVAQHEAAGVR